MAGADEVILRNPVELDFGHLTLVLARGDDGMSRWLLYVPGLDGPGGRSVASGFCTGEAALTAGQLRAAANALESEGG